MTRTQFIIVSRQERRRRREAQRTKRRLTAIASAALLLMVALACLCAAAPPTSEEVAVWIAMQPKRSAPALVAQSVRKTAESGQSAPPHTPAARKTLNAVSWQQAQASHRKTLIYVDGGPTCGNCLLFRRDCERDPRVIEAWQDFLFVRVERKDAATWGVANFPGLIVVGEDWTVKARYVCPHTPEACAGLFQEKGR